MLIRRARRRSGDPLVAIMEPANLRNRDDPATWRGFYDSWLGTVVVERLVWPRGLVVTEVAAEEPAEMSLVQDEAMIQALTADRSDHPLHEGVRHPGALAGVRRRPPRSGGRVL